MTVIGIYEKALPKNISWFERLNLAKKLGFNFIEMSIDETDERLSRLYWEDKEIYEVLTAINETGIGIYSICLSGHRRFPLGSRNIETRNKSLEIMEKAINLASKLGVRNIQLAGYDVYYEEKNVLTREYFIENVSKAVKMAAAKQMTLSIEIMDDYFINSLTKFNNIKQQIPSPWLQAYPDIGNLSAWPENDIGYELEVGIESIAAIHIKDTKKMTPDFPGQFKNVPFGRGDVDFLGCFKTLKRLGYEGTFLIEMWSEVDENPEERVNEAKEFLFPIMNEAGYEVGISSFLV
ncbi:L-ribulose-5-phosphate 3-epimerase [Amphibacillus cookii]|uniref:L-ribulose-5-phosphate 3-epimerase n=1 Tax=Amphibacillus cookii TaxID=767787 RepID=UPI0030840D83|nr:hexulose-6-phosphate isomerase [Amphibacillus cookii]